MAKAKDLTAKYEYVKIRRHAERFWLVDVEQEAGDYSGRVVHKLVRAPYQQGERIPFNSGEIVDFANRDDEYTYTQWNDAKKVTDALFKRIREERQGYV